MPRTGSRQRQNYWRSRSQALPAYLGGKRLLAPLIFAELAKAVPSERWPELTLLDPMCGGGSVALLAKMLGFRVVASDLAERGAVVARALIANSSVRVRHEDVLSLFLEPPSLYRRAAANYVPSVFDARQAEWLDTAAARAEAHAEPLRSLLKLLVIKIALRLQPMSMLRGTDARAALTGDYDRVSPRRLGHYLKAQRLLRPEAVWQIGQEVNAGVFGGIGHARQGDAVAVIRDIKPDVLYLDPPYPGTTRYEREYRPLDDLLGDESVNSTQPADLSELLAAAAAVPIVVLSYGGPRVSLDQLIATVAKDRKVLSALAVPYAHLRSIAKEEKNATNQELIVIAARAD